MCLRHRSWILPLAIATALATSEWRTARAAPTQTSISFSFSGGGSGSTSSFTLRGSGTISPYGQTTLYVSGASTGGGALNVSFSVTFVDGSTVSATSTANQAGNTFSGTATITSGTGNFAGVTGSFTYVMVGELSFTLTGSGTIYTVTGLQNYYFSDLAFGGGFQTTLTYINYGPQQVECYTSFYGDGGNPLSIPFSAGTNTNRTDFLAPGGSIHDQTVASSGGSPIEGWALVTCSAPVEASLLYRYFNASGTPLGEASVNAETASTTKFVTFAQTQTGVAYANPSATQTASITFTVLNTAGAQLGSQTISLGPLQHGSENPGPTLNLSSFTGSIQITSNIPIVSLSINAETFPVISSLPPGDLPATLPTGSQSYYFSDLAFGGTTAASYQTTLTYINYGSTQVTCVTNFYGDNGKALQIPFSQGTIVSRTDILPPGGSIHDQTVTTPLGITEGWAQATCSGPVQASLLYRLFESGAEVGEAGVNAETAATTKFATFAQTQTGVAYGNPSTTQSATVTFVVLNQAGQVVGSTVQTLGPMAHTAFNVGPQVGLASFTGSLQITSTSPIISLSLNAEAFPVFSSLPPGDLPSSTVF